MNREKRNTFMFCGKLLPSSETFIPSQGELLESFLPHYVGTRYVDGIVLPKDRNFAFNRGGVLGHLNEAAFKVSGFSPRMVRTIKRLDPALIHAHFGPCGALALPLMRATKLPLLVTYHGLDATMSDEYALADSLSTRIYLRRRETLKRQTKQFIAVSNFIKNELISQGFAEEKIVVHYIGVDIEKFNPDIAIPRRPVVLFVGRLTEKKGCTYLIEAMAQVEAQVPDVELVIIGDGPLRPELEAQAAASLERCRFLGVQPPATVRKWLNEARVFCVPSIQAASGDREGFGIVFAEAQAMRLPVVSSMSGGIPEAVAHEKTGLLVPERDAKGLAKSILQLLENELLWQRFSAEGLKRVRAEFDLRKQTQQLEAIYHHVINEKPLKG